MTGPTLSVSSDYSILKERRCRKMWQPIFNVRTGLPFIVLISFIFLILSFFLLISPSSVYDVEIDYTDCQSIENPLQKCIDLIKTGTPCSCRAKFDIGQSSISRLHIYVKLEGMYQNHRIYAESHDLAQEVGEPLSAYVSDECKPMDSVQGEGPIAPCGLIPNSLFNDTISISHNGSNVPIQYSNIINFSELKKFKNPPGDPLSSAFVGFAKPPDWVKPIYELDKTDPNNNGFLNVHYIQWLRVYPFPGALKLFGSIPNTYTQLEHGEYSIVIRYNYNVRSFNGRKRLIITQATWLGRPKNIIGYVYCGGLIVGILVSILFSISIWRQNPKYNTIL